MLSLNVYDFTDYMLQKEKESLNKLLEKEIKSAEDVKLKKALENIYLKLKIAAKIKE